MNTTKQTLDRCGNMAGWLTHTIAAALVATLLTACDSPAEVDPVTRAAIFGCIEVAEDTSLSSDSVRATLLEQAGCGRYSSKQITALVPAYREEQARKMSLETARQIAAPAVHKLLSEVWWSMTEEERLADCQGDSQFPYEWCSEPLAKAKEARQAAQTQRFEAFAAKCVKRVTSQYGYPYRTAENYCRGQFLEEEREREARERQAARQGG